MPFSAAGEIDSIFNGFAATFGARVCTHERAAPMTAFGDVSARGRSVVPVSIAGCAAIRCAASF